MMQKPNNFQFYQGKMNSIQDNLSWWKENWRILPFYRSSILKSRENLHIQQPKWKDWRLC